MSESVGFLLDQSEVASAIAVLTDLQAVLDAQEFARTEILPSQGGLLDVTMDPVNVVQAARGRSNALQPSAMAKLYLLPLRRKHSPAVDLHRLFSAGESLPRPLVERLLPGGLAPRLIEAGVLSRAEDEIRSEVLLTSHRRKLYLSDSLRYRHDPDFCYLGRLSFSIPDLLLDGAEGFSRRPRRLLDLGCGAGVGAIALTDFADEVIGTDVVARCVRFAAVNAALNHVSNAAFARSDLFDEVQGTFDAVVTHPPGGWSLAATTAAVAAADGGGDFGLELALEMIGGSLARLRPGGAVYAILFAPVLHGRPYAPDVLERICADHPAEVVLYPLLEYYEYENRHAYTEHGVNKLVRYLAVLRPAEKLTVRYGRREHARLLSARVRTWPARLAARITTRPASGSAARPQLTN